MELQILVFIVKITSKEDRSECKQAKNVSSTKWLAMSVHNTWWSKKCVEVLAHGRSVLSGPSKIYTACPDLKRNQYVFWIQLKLL